MNKILWEESDIKTGEELSRVMTGYEGHKFPIYLREDEVRFLKLKESILICFNIPENVLDEIIDLKVEICDRIHNEEE